MTVVMDVPKMGERFRSVIGRRQVNQILVRDHIALAAAPQLLKALEEENARLKRLLAEAMLERAIEGAIGSSPMASAGLKNLLSRRW